MRTTARNLRLIVSASLLAVVFAFVSPGKAECAKLPDIVAQAAGQSIFIGTHLSVTDGFTPTSSTLARNNRAYIRLEILENSPAHVSGTFTADVTLKYQLTHFDGTVTTVAGKKLSVTFSNNETETYVHLDQVIDETGIQSIFAEVTGIVVNGLPVSPLTYANVRLMLLLEREVFTQLSFTPPLLLPALAGGFLQTSPGTVNGQPANVSAEGTVKVSWKIVDGAEEYELEWEYVDVQSYSSGYKNLVLRGLALVDPPNFREGATRVTLTPSSQGTSSLTSFEIPYIYGPGIIFWRVRAVGRHPQDLGVKLYGPWTSGPANCSGPCHANDWLAQNTDAFYSPVGHQSTMNYQAGATFAEDAKYKVVSSYFDGTLRNRQTVTQNNTENIAVVGETVYDYLGRPVVQVLPVPAYQYGDGTGTISRFVRHYEDFNRSAADPSRAYDYRDLLATQSQNCQVIPVAMAENSGAARYYSTNNPLTTRSQAYLPTAGGYPFTVTQYTADNTGRVQAQSGVGEAHRLGSTHETEYYYGTPMQEELDRLFGSDVGHASHYIKNMVRDANGGFSVSYLDMHGRTVATALVGSTPEERYTELDGAPQPGTLTVNLAGGAPVQSAENGELVTTKTFTATSEGIHVLDYSMNANQLRLELCEICPSCVYDLEITVRDACGADVITPILQPLGNESTTCDESGNGSISYQSGQISMTLTPGQYTITKTLRVNREVMERYIQAQLEEVPCSTFTDVEIPGTVEVDDTHCTPINRCDDCEGSLGGELAFIEVLKTTYLIQNGLDDSHTFTQTEQDIFTAAWNRALTACEDECRTVPSYCATAYELMLNDVSPHGQYGEVDDLGNVTLSTMRSVFFDGSPSLLPNGNWRSVTYYDENGMVSTVTVGGANIQMTHPIPGTVSLADFLGQWRDSWKYSLVTLHPEFSCYEQCHPYSLFPANNPPVFTSDQYDYQLLQTETFQQAFERGFLDPLEMTPGFLANWSPGPGCPTCTTAYNNVRDPFFNPTYSSHFCPTLPIPGVLTPAMEEKIENYNGGTTDIITMWNVAAHMVNCGYAAANQAQFEFCADQPINQFGANGASTFNLDMQWKTFRALYLAYKRQLQMDNCETCNDNIDCSTPEFAALYDGQTRYFVRACGEENPLDQFASEFPGNPPTNPSDLADQANAQAYLNANGGYTNTQCVEACSTNAESWIHSLRECFLGGPLLPGAQGYDELFGYFVELCSAGCSPATPFGATDLAPGVLSTPTGFNSIRDVLDAFSNQYSTILPGDWESATCNPYNIRFPGVQGTSISPAAGIQPMDECVCEKLCSLETAYAALTPAQRLAAGEYYTFVNNSIDGQFLNRADLSSLMCFCRAYQQYAAEAAAQDPPAPVSIYSYAPLYPNPDGTPFALPFVPAGLACPCKTCEQFTAAYNDFEAYAATLSPPLTDADPAYPSVFTGFLNARFRYSLGINSYLEALGNCYLDTQMPLDSAQANAGEVTICNVQTPLTEDCAPYPCCELEAEAEAEWQQALLQRQYEEELRVQFRAAYIARCLGAATAAEQFTLQLLDREYHYTLYYYDQAGNLLATVPPAGVQRLNLSQPAPGGTTLGQTIVNRRNAYTYNTAAASRVNAFQPGAGLGGNNGHRLFSEYHYNSLNAITGMQTPDGGRTYTWYDQLGRVVLTQNEKQAAQAQFNQALPNGTASPYRHRRYSYTLYDNLNRPYITGELLKQHFDGVNGAPAFDLAGTVSNLDPAYWYYTPLHRYAPDGSPTPNAANPLFLHSPALASEPVDPAAACPALGDRLFIVNYACLQTWVTTNDNTGGGTLAAAQPVHPDTRLRYTTTTHWDAPQLTTPLTATVGSGTVRNRVAAVLTSTDTLTAPQIFPTPPVGGAGGGLTAAAGHNNHYDHAIHYTYDIHGNVSTLLHDYRFLATAVGTVAQGQSYGYPGALRYKRIDYRYDLISGNVNRVDYQPNAPDYFAHRYTYDADNRLRRAETTRSGHTWDVEAQYFYYQHGPLARAEIGHNKVQGLDYAYTLHGWVKSVNSPSLTATRDPGRDGLFPHAASTPYDPANTALHQFVARDAAAYTLRYYAADYTQISPPSNPALAFEPDDAPLLTGPGGAFRRDLYNGNIAAMSVGILPFMTGQNGQPGTPVMYLYQYDRLNRLKAMASTLGWDPAAHTWANTLANPYQASYTYDANGNIQTLNRTVAGVPMDLMAYNYQPNTNQLRWVTDGVAPAAFTNDFENQAQNNYNYDPTGNLARDDQAFTTVTWTPANKPERVRKNPPGGPVTNVYYNYSPDGHRIYKSVNTAGEPAANTLYVRDAQGNVLAVYDVQPVTPTVVNGGNQTIRNEWFTAIWNVVGPNPKDFLSVFACGATPTPQQLSNTLAQVSPSTWNQFHNRLVQFCPDAQDPCYYAGKINAFLQGLYALPNGAALVEQLTANLNVTSHSSTERMAEAHIYGSSRLGISAQVVETTVKRWKLPCTTDTNLLFTDWYPASSNTANRNLRGWKRYELTNHLGNVLAVVSDKHLSQDVDANNKVDFYFADIISAQDYWPFGSGIQERTFVASGAGDYRYGFNGKEADGDFGNQYDFGARIYNSVLGRWLSIDPRDELYPSIAPYVSFANGPLYFVDEGGETLSIGGSSFFQKTVENMLTYTRSTSTSFNQLLTRIERSPRTVTIMDNTSGNAYFDLFVRAYGRMPNPDEESMGGSSVISDALQKRYAGFKRISNQIPGGLFDDVNGIGSNSYVLLDISPATIEYLRNEDDDYVDPNLVLIHELYHAYSQIFGISRYLDAKKDPILKRYFEQNRIVSSVSVPFFDKQTSSPLGNRNLSIEEFNAVTFENKVRSELPNTPKRRTYEPDDSSRAVVTE